MTTLNATTSVVTDDRGVMLWDIARFVRTQYVNELTVLNQGVLGRLQVIEDRLIAAKLLVKMSLSRDPETKKLFVLFFEKRSNAHYLALGNSSVRMRFEIDEDKQTLASAAGEAFLKRVEDALDDPTQVAELVLVAKYGGSLLKAFEQGLVYRRQYTNPDGTRVHPYRRLLKALRLPTIATGAVGATIAALVKLAGVILLL